MGEDAAGRQSREQQAGQTHPFRSTIQSKKTQRHAAFPKKMEGLPCERLRSSSVPCDGWARRARARFFGGQLLPFSFLQLVFFQAAFGLRYLVVQELRGANALDCQLCSIVPTPLRGERLTNWMKAAVNDAVYTEAPPSSGFR